MELVKSMVLFLIIGFDKRKHRANDKYKDLAHGGIPEIVGHPIKCAQ